MATASGKQLGRSKEADVACAGTKEIRGDIQNPTIRFPCRVVGFQLGLCRDSIRIFGCAKLCTYQYRTNPEPNEVSGLIS